MRKEGRRYSYRNTGFADMRDRIAQKEKENTKTTKKWKPVY